MAERRPDTDPLVADRAALEERVQEFLVSCDPRTTNLREFLGARFDAGLAWVHFPVGLGGLGLPRAWQHVVESALVAAGAPTPELNRSVIGLGMAAPTILRHGTDAQRRRYLRPLWTGEEVWCQLFSEPDAGSDLAGLASRAVRDETDGSWVLDGQKVWTSLAREADRALALVRTDPVLPKHQGLTYFLLDMHAPGVEVRPLRQLTGEAEFHEVILCAVRVPDDDRLGPVGDGWRVARSTLMNERLAIGGAAQPVEGGAIGRLATTWRTRPELRSVAYHDRLLKLWVRAEAARLTGERLRQQLAAGEPGPEGSAVKVTFARLNQEIYGLELELLGEDALRYEPAPDSTPGPDGRVEPDRDSAGYRYLRARANSIEGGTSEILRGIIAERVLGLPPEPRTDLDVAWRDLPQ